mmetsp:Transcript_6504/g.9464  ORF Transcript_6504/g.9464 Transcript_6504/m.9464 type:complete len:147 (-) Transcript_6504:74-514(-)
MGSQKQLATMIARMMKKKDLSRNMMASLNHFQLNSNRFSQIETTMNKYFSTSLNTRGGHGSNVEGDEYGPYTESAKFLQAPKGMSPHEPKGNKTMAHILCYLIFLYFVLIWLRPVYDVRTWGDEEYLRRLEKIRKWQRYELAKKEE